VVEGENVLRRVKSEGGIVREEMSGATISVVNCPDPKQL